MEHDHGSRARQPIRRRGSDMNGSTTQAAGPDLRVSDKERDAVAEELARHLQDGRLDAAEFDERVGQAMAARTRRDLDRPLADLPRRPPEQPPAPRGAGRLAAVWPFPLAPIAVVALFLAIAGAAGHPGGPHDHPVWALVWLVWLIPVTVFATRRRLRGYRPPR
jgi:hypothetical protein